MADQIIYCSDINILKQELKENGMYDVETDSYTHHNTMTPIVYNGVKSISLVRDNKLDLELFPSLTLLGTYDEIFANPTLDAIYKSVYPYDVPIEYIDDEGNPQSYMRPQKIGVFL